MQKMEHIKKRIKCEQKSKLQVLPQRPQNSLNSKDLLSDYLIF